MSPSTNLRRHSDPDAFSNKTISRDLSRESSKDSSRIQRSSTPTKSSSEGKRDDANRRSQSPGRSLRYDHSNPSPRVVPIRNSHENASKKAPKLKKIQFSNPIVQSLDTDRGNPSNGRSVGPSSHSNDLRRERDPGISNISHLKPHSDVFPAREESIQSQFHKYQRRRQRLMELGVPRHLSNNSVIKIPSMSRKWFPPSLTYDDYLKINPLSDTSLSITQFNQYLLPITDNQIKSVNEWFKELMISPIRDGEGGIFHHQSYTMPIQTEPLPLFHDRIRNGVIFYEILRQYEPQVIHRSNLSKYIYLHPKSMLQALENCERVLWLWSLCKSPPLSEALLSQPHEIVRGNKQVIWALLYEIMLAYRSRKSFESNENESKDPSLVSPRYNQSSSYRQLPYNQRDRRLLDLSLQAWLHETGILSYLTGNSVSINQRQQIYQTIDIKDHLPVSTILSYEKYLRDGTLFCYLLTSQTFLTSSTDKSSYEKYDINPKVIASITALSQHNLLASQWYRDPKTFQHCLSNVSAACSVLRNIPNMSQRFLYHGIETEIVRGHWDGILGLLEDVHRFCDGKSQPSGTGQFLVNYRRLHIVER